MKLKHTTPGLKYFNSLNFNRNGFYLDLTFGTGQHSKIILNNLSPTGLLIAIDLSDQLNNYDHLDNDFKMALNKNFFFENDNFINLKTILKKYQTRISNKKIDGVVIDVGISDNQFLDKTKGFSFLYDSPLDMRINKFVNRHKTAFIILKKYSKLNLYKMFQRTLYNNLARKITELIVQQRHKKTIFSSLELRILIERKFFRFNKMSQLLSKVFLAIRIEVNDEIKNLEQLLIILDSIIKKETFIFILTFNSLETQVIKKFLKQHSLQYKIEWKKKENKKKKSKRKIAHIMLLTKIHD